MKWTVVIAIACSAVTLSAAAQGTAGKGPLSFQVAGVRLGMSHAEAKAALSGTYRCSDEGRALTFEEEVANEVKRRRGERGLQWVGTAPAWFTCQGPNGEALRLDFLQESGGPVVDKLVLTVPSARVAVADVLRQIAGRFGKLTIGTVPVGAWCDPGYKCDTAILMSEGPIFTVRAADNGVTVAGARGYRAGRGIKAAIQAEADRVSPKKGGAAL